MKLRLLACALFAVALTAQAQSQHPQIALTFDDLPATGALAPDTTRLALIQSILDTLHREHLPPVYGFINAQRLTDGPNGAPILSAWRASGNLLGSHTYSHPDLEVLTVEAFEADILKNEPVLQQYTGSTDWHYFRYPYLREGETLEKRQAVQGFLKQHGYTNAQVSLDFEDYLWNAPYARCVAQNRTDKIDALHDSYLATADQYINLFRAMTTRLYGHEIPYVLLLHVTSFNAKMLPDLIALLRARGFTFTTLPAALKDPAYAQDPAIGYPTGGTLQELAYAARKWPAPPNAKPYEALERVCSKPKSDTPPAK